MTSWDYGILRRARKLWGPRGLARVPTLASRYPDVLKCRLYRRYSVTRRCAPFFLGRSAAHVPIMLCLRFLFFGNHTSRFSS